jgi:hypothetical protein
MYHILLGEADFAATLYISADQILYIRLYSHFIYVSL